MTTSHPTPAGALPALVALATVAALLGGCATPESIVQGPLTVPPARAPLYVERINNGSIFQAGMPSASLFSTERKPGSIGDSIKIDISETLAAKREINRDTSRENKVASKGPGSSSATGLVGSMMNLDAQASGSDSFKGSGSTSNTSSFTGQIAASVINVLPNGHLVVAGERSISLNGSVSTLRFSGIVNPRDIKSGNVVASGDAMNARMEVVGRGDVSDAATRTWLQRVLTNSLTVW